MMSDTNLYLAGVSLLGATVLLLYAHLSTETDAKKLRGHWKWVALCAFLATLSWYMAELDVRDHKLMEELCATPTPK